MRHQNERDAENKIDQIFEYRHHAFRVHCKSYIHDTNDHDNQKQQPHNDGLPEVILKTNPEFFERIDLPITSQKSQHYMVHGSEGRTCRHDRHTHKHEHDVSSDNDPAHIHRPPKGALIIKNAP